jgi:protein-tyrosine kinase
MADEPNHLVERVAQRLRGVGGLPLGETRPVEPIEVAEPASPRPPAETSQGAPPPPNLLDTAPDSSATAADGATDDTIIAVNADGVAEVPPEMAAAMAGRSADADVDTLRRPVDPEVMLARVAADAPGSLARVVGDAVVPQPPLEPVVLPPLTLDLVALERAGMVVGRKARTRISEEFRVSVGQILRSIRGSYAPGRGQGNLVMVTSARPYEGKSFTALNLAASIAQHSQRDVVLVDVDAKQNAISDQLGIGDRPGLIDFALTPSLRIEDALVRTVIPNLSIIPVGIRRVDSADGGADGTVARPITALIERLGRRFANSIVIFDAPPCLSTSDPSTLAPFVGQVLLVVEAERTQRSEVLAALDLIKACPTITLLLNKIRVTTSYTFGAYHYFGSYS